MINIAEEYFGIFLIKAGNRVISDSTMQYGEFLDLCKRYGEENIFEEDKAPEEIKAAYELEGLKPYLNNLPETGMKLSYSVDDKMTTLKINGVPVQATLDCAGNKEIAAMIIGHFYEQKKARIMKAIPFSGVVIPTLRKLLVAA